MKNRFVVVLLIFSLIMSSVPALGLGMGNNTQNSVNNLNAPAGSISSSGYPETIEFYKIQNIQNVILQIAKGEYDMGMFSFPLNWYNGLGADVLANLSLYRGVSSYNELTFNTYHDPDKDAPIVTTANDTYFNPFAVRKIRFALNYLINRDHIVQNIYSGGGAPMLGCIRPSHPANKYFEPVYLALNLTGEGNVTRAMQLFREGMNESIQKVSKYGHTIENINGTWYFDGQPVTVKFIIRVEDERKEIGLYVADLIEQYFGFKVERLLWDRREAFQVVFAKPPSNYEWNIYTGGWGASGLPSVWVDDYTAWFYAAWYGYVPGEVEPKHVNTVTVREALAYVENGDINLGISRLNMSFYDQSNDLGPILNFTEEELTYLLTYSTISKSSVNGVAHLNSSRIPEIFNEYLGTYWMKVGENASVPSTEFKIKLLDADVVNERALVEVTSPLRNNTLVLNRGEYVDVFGNGELILSLKDTVVGIDGIIMAKIKAFKSSSKIQILTQEQYWDLQKISMLIGVLESERIFLIETWEFYPANKQRVTSIISEPNTGIENRWSLMSAETPDRKLRIPYYGPSGSSMFWSSFTPIGSWDKNVLLIWNLISNPAAFTDFSGETKPLRCNWTVERGEFTVPSDAVIYNQTQGWIAENAGKQAQVRVRVVCDVDDNWHNNVKISVDDIKNYIAFLYTWAYKDSPTDNYYSDTIKWRLASSLGSILGLQWTENGYIVYGNYQYPMDDNVTGAFYALYPQLPWELYWAIGELVANPDAYGLPANYSFDGVNGKISPDLLTKQTVGNLTKILQYALDNSGFEKSFPEISMGDLKNRAAADLTFANTYGHLAISNGPYYIANYSIDNYYLKLLRFNGTVPITPMPSQTKLTFRTPIRAHPNGLTVLNVILNTTKSLGALQFNVSFDPSVIQVVNFTGGNALPDDAYIEKNINNTAGVVAVAIVTTSGISLNGTVVKITVRVNATVGDSPEVSIIPVKASDPTGREQIVIQPYSAEIKVVPPGDIDGDNIVTAIDALLYLRASVGLSTEPYNVDPVIDDITGDGKITVADALKALRIAVGLESI